MKKRLSPLLWSLFSAGGTIAAILFPVHVVLVGFAFPLGWVDAPGYLDSLALVRHPFARLYLFALISLPLFHSAHRFRYTLYDGLKLKHLEPVIVAVCYGMAVLGSLAAAMTLLTLS
jgi:fumarate reductase subunit D